MRCRRCRFTNPEGFRFCGRCGNPLAAENAVGEERKLVTALFCDVAGFTALAERLDPEDVHGLLAPYYRSARAELERFGGTVEKFIGDAVVGLFGAPRAHGDDPERAVRAALAIRDAVADRNEVECGADLHVRIGITTGEAVVALGAHPSQGEGMAWGDVVNTSARLQAVAPIDGVLVDEATYRATRAVIDYTGPEEVEAKGKSERVPAWRALAPGSHRGLELSPAGGDTAVGRDGELAVLIEALERVRGTRTPELVTLLGDPGIGKSRLVYELFRSVEADPALTTWRQGRSPPFGAGASYWALGEIVKGQAGILETDGAAAAAGKLRRTVRSLVSSPADAARIESHLWSLAGLRGEPTHTGNRGAAFAAWRHFLEALARLRPLVLVFEDLHWADDGLLDFIESLLDWARELPILVLCTGRPELTRRRSWSGRPSSTTLVLAPLSEGETGELVASLLQDDALRADLGTAIVAGSEGNPLYAVEFVRMLSHSEAGGAVSLAELPLPESLHGIVAARVDTLVGEEKALLQDAAVVGRVVWPGVLAAIGGLPRKRIERRLRALERKEFLVATRRTSVAGEREYRFRHALIRDVAYRQVPRSRRSVTHCRAAEWLEALSPDRSGDRAEMLAHHYEAAYELAQATGGDTSRLAERARLALRGAGDRALSLHAFPAAARYFRRALELWPPDDAERPELLLRLGKGLYYADTAGEDVLAQARETLLSGGDHAAAAEADCFLAALAYHHGQRDLAFEHLERAAVLTESLGPSRSRVEVLVDLAGNLAVAGEPDRAIDLGEQALEMARALGLREYEAHALSLIGISRGFLGDPNGTAELERSIAIAEEIDSHLSAHCCGTLADLKGVFGELEACFELQARARRHAERFGHGGFVRWLTAERVCESYWTGRWDEAGKLADSLISEAERGLPNFMEGHCRAMRGKIRLARGDEAGALNDSAKALDFARAAKDLQMLYPALAFRARALAACGLVEEGSAAATELLETWRDKVDALPAAAWAVDLACALRDLSRGDDLREAAEHARVWTRWLEAGVALGAGSFGEAAAQFERIGSLPDAALARLRLGESMLGARHDGARRELERARIFYLRVGAHGYLKEIDALLVGDRGLVARTTES